MKHLPGRALIVGVSAIAVLTSVLLDSPDAFAQEVGCTLQQTGIPAREVVRCRDGLTIEAAAGADYTLVDHDRDLKPDSAALRSGAILIDVPTGSTKRVFQVTTPQAVAAVRGTQWAVDAGSGTTAVFVVVGQVSVRRRSSTRSVTLGAGQGVDVASGTSPLEVKQWSPARARALLARFGR
jgi:ferric-dicitrate binding protein FerR (iron transport regulator)